MDLFKVDTLTPYLADLVELLLDAVEQGAAIGFLAPLSAQEAQDYWQSVNAELQQNTRQVILVRVDEKVVGAIQLLASAKANALHRITVEKWMVHSAYQGQGLGSGLLQGAEKVAASLNGELLICEAQAKGRSETVLASHHWQKVGDIPHYFRTVTGNFHDCAIYYKSIEPTQELYV